MNFLYPQNFIFGVIVFFILIINKKVLFTHLEFFKKRNFFHIPLLDILILISLTLLLMYPVTTKTYKAKAINSYSISTPKKYIILILDVSLSMRDNDFFEKEKEDAKWKILSNEGNYIMLVVFEKDYKIIKYFTTDTNELLNALDSLRLNMVTHIGGSMLRDTVAGIINGFKDLHPEIIVFSDGSESDESSVTKEELKKLAKSVNIEYVGYGDSKNNRDYIRILDNKVKEKTLQPKTEILEKEVKYKVFDVRFIYLALILMFIKILRLRFENRFNLF